MANKQAKGRPPGFLNKKTRAIAEKAAAEGITPLEVMLMAMRQALDRKDMVAAEAAAKDAAPYMHPRLNATTLDANVSLLGTLTLDDKRALLAALAALPGGAAGADEGTETRH